MQIDPGVWPGICMQTSEIFPKSTISSPFSTVKTWSNLTGSYLTPYKVAPVITGAEEEVTSKNKKQDINFSQVFLDAVNKQALLNLQQKKNFNFV